MYSSGNEYLFDVLALCRLCLSGDENDSESLARIRNEERDAAHFPTLLTLQSALGLSDCETFCAMLILGCELDGSLQNQMRELCGTPFPNFDTLFAAWSREHRVLPEELIAAAHPDAPLSRFALDIPEAAAIPLHTPLRLRANIVAYLASGRIPDNRFYGFFPPCDLLPLHQAVFSEVYGFAEAVLCGDETGYLYLCGKTGGGRRCLAARTAWEFGLPCMRVSMNAVPAEQDARYRLSRVLAADAVLSRAALCVEDYAAEHEESLRALLEFLPKRGFLLFVIGEKETAPPYIADRPVCIGHVRALSRQDLRLVAGYGREEPLPDGFPDHLHLSVSDARRAVQYARRIAASRGEEHFTAEDFTLAVRESIHRMSNAQILKNNIKLDDVILANETRKKLDLLCRFIQSGEAVREQWGFSAIQTYGTGVVGLFCGASGTGKTMAANGIANRMGLQLMRIDLSKIFDKFIGETEKRLSQLFKEASTQNCILFFDEADALFSKRTEISSSHDRYANVETSFLLQCIEEFRGVTILSTNLFQNFDEAFMRRITVIVRFHMPDEHLRYNLWKEFFPPETPLAPDVDIAELARELELSPAIIKSAAFTAAILASGDGEPVTMRHVLSALENELGKWGREQMLKELGIATA